MQGMSRITRPARVSLALAFLGLVCVIGALKVDGASTSAQEPPVHISAEPIILQVNETKPVNFMISVPEGQLGYGAYTVDITYNKSVATAACGAGPATCNADYQGQGKIRLVDISIVGVSDQLIKTVNFTGVQAGNFTFQYTIVTCTNSQGVPFQGCTGSGGGVLVEGGPPATATNTGTATATATNTSTTTTTPVTQTSTPTSTSTSTATPTGSATATPTRTSTATPTATSTVTATPPAYRAFGIYTARDGTGQ